MLPVETATFSTAAAAASVTAKARARPAISSIPMFSVPRAGGGCRTPADPSVPPTTPLTHLRRQPEGPQQGHERSTQQGQQPGPTLPHSGHTVDWREVLQLARAQQQRWQEQEREWKQTTQLASQQGAAAPPLAHPMLIDSFR